MMVRWMATHASTYGDAFADVYDDWYSDISDVDSDGRPPRRPGRRRSRRRRCSNSASAPAAWRFRWPQRGLEVVGLDASAAMLGQLAENDPTSDPSRCMLGDMVDDLPAGPFDLVFVAYNTFFDLLTGHASRPASPPSPSGWRRAARS